MQDTSSDIQSELKRKRSKLDVSDKKLLKAKFQEGQLEKAVSDLRAQCKELEDQLKQKKKELELASTAKERASRKCQARKAKRRKLQHDYDSFVESLYDGKEYPGTATASSTIATTVASSTINKNDLKNYSSFSKKDFLQTLQQAPGKVGDMVRWHDEIYYYCQYDHRKGRWGTHHPSDCPRAKSISVSGSAGASSSSSSTQQEQGRQEQRTLTSSGDATNSSEKNSVKTELDAKSRMTKAELIKLAQESDAFSDAKSKLTEFVTTAPIETLRCTLQLTTPTHALMLNWAESNELMRVFTKGRFHSRPDFRERICKDPDLHSYLISAKGGVLLSGSQLADKQKRLISILDLKNG